MEIVQPVLVSYHHNSVQRGWGRRNVRPRYYRGANNNRSSNYSWVPPVSAPPPSPGPKSYVQRAIQPRPRPVNDHKPIEVRQVWNNNVEAEFGRIHWAIRQGYTVVSLDTEFPGFCYTPQGVPTDYRCRDNEEHYAVMKMNVEMLKLIQVGITLSDESGILPDFGTEKRVVWEFNFSDFDEARDPHNRESIELLKQQGINFKFNQENGISSERFAGLLLRSGLIGGGLTWITFQGGVDLAYLLKMFLTKRLPSDSTQFMAWIGYYFGQLVFDVKHIATQCPYLNGGLNKVASAINVHREAGESHRAGSDSLLTGMVYQKIRTLYFKGQTRQFAGKLHNFV